MQIFIPYTSLIKYYFIQNAEHLIHSAEVPLTRCLIIKHWNTDIRSSKFFLILHIQMQPRNSNIKIYLNVKSIKVIINYGLQIFSVPVYNTDALRSQKKKERKKEKNRYYDVLKDSLGSVVSFSLLSNKLTVLHSSY